MVKTHIQSFENLLFIPAIVMNKMFDLFVLHLSFCALKKKERRKIAIKMSSVVKQKYKRF